jgi:hypothetical protein
MRAMLTFMIGMWRLPVAVRLWLGALMAVNMLAPLFLLGHFEAQVVLATFFASFALMLMLTARAGFTRILGLGHVLWIPLIVFLWPRVADHADGDPVGVWLRLLIASNAISLTLDTLDVVRFLRGDRAAMVGARGTTCEGA